MAPPENKRRATVFFIHGGGWNKGTPEFFKFIGNYFAQLGFRTIMPAYRLAPEFQFPSQENDIFQACQQSQEILAGEDSTAEEIIIAGQSAGAHLGSLLLLNQAKQEEYGIKSDLFSGFFSLSGPLDFSIRSEGKRAERIFFNFVPTKEKIRQANPVGYIEEEIGTDIFCLHGAKDPLVPKEHSIKFTNKVKTIPQAEVRLEIKDNKYHSDLMNIFFKPEEDNELLEWLEKVDG